jgi:hypothetical protein
MNLKNSRLEVTALSIVFSKYGLMPIIVEDVPPRPILISEV